MNKVLSKAKKYIQALNGETIHTGRSIYSTTGWDGVAKILLWIVLPIAMIAFNFSKDLIAIVVIAIVLIPIIMKQIK